VIYCCEHHDEVLAHWRRRDLRDVSLTHVDFHDDLRGLLVDRRRGVAYAVGRPAPGLSPLDPGNFLAHAVLEGRLREVRWVHDRIGGRAWDAGIVRYESDLFAAHHRLRHRISGGPEFPLEFSETLLDAWTGPGPQDLLSVDWDCFASVLLDAEGIGGRVERFFDRLGPVVPCDTWVAYSPEYSHPTLEAFKAFVERLGARLAQPVEWLGEGLSPGRLTQSCVRPEPPRNPVMRFVLFLRRKGIY
jgi:hypothetical protein